MDDATRALVQELTGLPAQLGEEEEGGEVRISKTQRGDWIVLLGKYDPRIIAELKTVVPPEHRQWRPIAQVWRIRPQYEQVVRGIQGVT